MADINITPALVKPSDSATIKRGVAGETFVQGAPIYKDATSKKFLASDANSPGKQVVDGISLNGASLGQPFLYAVQDPAFDLGVTVGSGVTVVLSGNVGKMAPDSDAASGWTKVVLGIGSL